MIDISKQAVKIDCPECNRLISVTLKQVANEVLIKCSCGQEVQLKDSNGTNKKAIKDVNKSFKDLERTLKIFGR
jgi:transcription elongation factor Elf1